MEQDQSCITPGTVARKVAEIQGRPRPNVLLDSFDAAAAPPSPAASALAASPARAPAASPSRLSAIAPAASPVVAAHLRRAEALLAQATAPEALAHRLLRELESFDVRDSLAVAAASLRREAMLLDEQLGEAQTQLSACIAMSTALAEVEPVASVTVHLARLAALDELQAGAARARRRAAGQTEATLRALLRRRLELQRRLNALRPGIDAGPPRALLGAAEALALAAAADEEGEEEEGEEDYDYECDEDDPPTPTSADLLSAAATLEEARTETDSVATWQRSEGTPHPRRAGGGGGGARRRRSGAATEAVLLWDAAAQRVSQAVREIRPGAAALWLLPAALAVLGLLAAGRGGRRRPATSGPALLAGLRVSVSADEPEEAAEEEEAARPRRDAAQLESAGFLRVPVTHRHAIFAA